MTLDLAALRRQAECCGGGDLVGLHPELVLELLAAADEIDSLRVKLKELGAEPIRVVRDSPSLLDATRRALDKMEDQRDDALGAFAQLKDKHDNWVVCYHCYETMPAPGADDHGRVCPKHPQRKVESERDALAARVAVLHDSLCGLMGIDGSPESLDQMRVGIMVAPNAPDDGAREASMRCVDALADTAQAATEYRERIVREEREAILAGVNPSVDELASVCFYCNSLVTLDYVLSDEFWQRAVPKEARLDVVCLSCLESLCPSSGVPEKEFVMLYYSGKSGTAAFIPAAAIRARGGSP